MFESENQKFKLGKDKEYKSNGPITFRDNSETWAFQIQNYRERILMII